MLISQRPQLTEEFIDSSRSKFVIEPLEHSADRAAFLGNACGLAGRRFGQSPSWCRESGASRSVVPRRRYTPRVLPA